jgi:hypothetical protein
MLTAPPKLSLLGGDYVTGSAILATGLAEADGLSPCSIVDGF